MSKEIFLYSEDNKYKCVVELADSLDRFNCPDHSVIMLFEEREEGTYIIAQSRDKRLETEKDQQIADLEAKLAESQNCACKHIGELTKIATEKDRKIEELKQQLAEKEKEAQEYLIKYKNYKTKCEKLECELRQLKENK